MSEMTILTLSFNAQSLKFQDDVSIGGKITVNVKFLNFIELFFYYLFKSNHNTKLLNFELRKSCSKSAIMTIE